VVFLALFLPASLRYGTGQDYFGYVNNFNNIETSTYGEIGWVLLNRGISYLGLSSQWIFVFSSFLIYFPICFVIKRKNFFYSIVFYVILEVYFKSFNIIRQMIAMSFIICAFNALEFKKYVSFLRWLIIACLFHLSTIFILPFLPFLDIKFRKHITLIIITIIGVFVCIKFNIFEIALYIFDKLHIKYASYEFSRYAAMRTSIGTGLGFFVKTLPAFLVVLASPLITKKYPQKAFLVNLSAIYICASVLASQFTILGRIRDLFLFVPVLTVGFAIQAMGKYKKFIAIAFIGLNLLVFERDMVRVINGHYSVWTYQYCSIFSDDVQKEEIKTRVLSRREGR
jgi:hypothetical protein